MNEIEQLLSLPLEFRVSVFVRVVQHAQPAVRGLQLFLISLRVMIKSGQPMFLLLYHLFYETGLF